MRSVGSAGGWVEDLTPSPSGTGTINLAEARRANRWLEPRVAEAFADQREARPYKEMLDDIADALSLQPGCRVLDLGCGSGRISQLVWEGSGGNVQIVGLDVNDRAGEIYMANAERLLPTPSSGAITFKHGDVSRPLNMLRERSFRTVVASLVLSYAESWDSTAAAWNRKALVRAVREVHRVLEDGGEFVWVNNVPNPNFTLIFLASWREILRESVNPRKLGRLLRNAGTMLSFSRWLKSCAREGRFHYLPLEDLVQILKDAKFREVRHRLSYAGQAYVISARK